MSQIYRRPDKLRKLAAKHVTRDPTEVQRLIEEGRAKEGIAWEREAKDPNEFYFTIEGVVRRIQTDREMMHRSLGFNDPIGVPLDMRIGYNHFAFIDIESEAVTERVLYQGTPVNELLTGHHIKATGWEGKLVRRPPLITTGNEFGYVLGEDRPRNVHRLEFNRLEGTMIYGPETANFPCPPPLGFEHHDGYLRIPYFHPKE